MYTPRSDNQHSSLRLVELIPLSCRTPAFSSRRSSYYSHLESLVEGSQNRKLIASFRPEDQVQFLIPLNRITTWKRNVVNTERIRQYRSPKKLYGARKNLRSLFEAPYSPTTALYAQGMIRKGLQPQGHSSRLMIIALPK